MQKLNQTYFIQYVQLLHTPDSDYSWTPSNFKVSAKDHKQAMRKILKSQWAKQFCYKLEVVLTGSDAKEPPIDLELYQCFTTYKDTKRNAEFLVNIYSDHWYGDLKALTIK